MKNSEFKPSEYIGKSGIYKLSIGGHIYVGSSKNLANRLIEHRSDLNHNQHSNQFLQNCFNKYGKDNLEIDILEYCDPEIRFDREKYWIDTLKSDLNAVDPKYIPPLTDQQKITLQESAKIAREIRSNQLLTETAIECYDYLGEYIQTFKNVVEAAKYFNTRADVIQKACSGYKKGLSCRGYRLRYENSKVPVQKFPLDSNQIGRRLDFYYIDDEGNEHLAFTNIKNVYKFFAEQVTKNKNKPIILIPKTKICSEEWDGLDYKANHIPSSIESVEKDQRLDKVTLADGAEGEISTSAAL